MLALLKNDLHARVSEWPERRRAWKSATSWTASGREGLPHRRGNCRSKRGQCGQAGEWRSRVVLQMLAPPPYTRSPVVILMLLQEGVGRRLSWSRRRPRDISGKRRWPRQGWPTSFSPWRGQNGVVLVEVSLAERCWGGAQDWVDGRHPEEEGS